MIAEWLAALEASSLAAALRRSVWVYPLINAAHILGVALLVGAMVPLDLRLLGGWRAVPLAPLWRVLGATAATGLALAVTAGMLLFSTRATEYAASGLFALKMMVVGVGIANAAILRLVGPPALADEPLSPWLRLAAGVSLGAWLTALLLGRLVGYF